MKNKFLKITLIVSLFALSFNAEAQLVYKSMTTTLTSSVDSVRCISTTPNYLYIAPTQSYSAATFQADVTRVSTAIGGTIFLQGSLDGTNWHNASLNVGDTVTVANSASQSLLIKVKASDGLMFRHYRLKCTGASSDTMTVKAKFVGR